MKVSQITSKQDLRNYYGFSADKLHKLMNVEYFEELQKFGYEKRQKQLTSKVINAFVDLHGTRVFVSDLDSRDAIS